MCVCVCVRARVRVHVCVGVETRSGYPGQLSQVLSGSSGSDPVYKISGFEPDSTLDHIY